MSLCFLSLETNKIFNKLILKNLESLGYEGLSESLVVLFPYIAEDKNITASQLAKKVGYSRQAMHKNIRKLEELEYITLVLQNQKEKTIILTNKGKDVVNKADIFIQKIQDELKKILGEDELNQYIKNQIMIYEYLNSLK